MKKSTRFNFVYAFFLALILILGMILGVRFLKDQGYTIQKPNQANTNSDRRVADILSLIQNNYVDEVNSDTLQNMPIDSLLQQLDPHSVYLPAEKAYAMSDDLEGNFEGIGVEYYILNDTLFITNVVKDGPAFNVGLKVGDKILKIDTVQVSGRSLPQKDMMGRLKGKKGSQVQVVIARRGFPQAIPMLIKRGKVEVNSVDAAYMLNAETGFIRISKFGANTEKDFVEALRGLKAKGLKKLVLDLRDNGGGYVTSATSLANHFFEQDKLIMYTQGRNEPRTDYFTTGGGEFEQGKLAVLINENSASAAEIIAGAIQDGDRGIIIGRRSFGKGLVQEQFQLDDGSALNLTVARYYTPLGRSIQKSYKKGYTAYKQELEERFNDGELTQPDGKKVDSLQKGTVYTTPAGKKVFGGGGITPDVFIKLDTTGYTKLYGKLLDERILFDYTFEILVKRYSANNLNQSSSQFQISETDWKDFIKYAQNKGVSANSKVFEPSKTLILSDLKLMLYRFYFGDQGYYRIANQTDPMIKSALSKLQ
ncbi:MAG: S41 family peptidase [Pedobacter sp.]|nr:MAG: S41 family peptidase [Pedobacter sp.]